MMLSGFVRHRCMGRQLGNTVTLLSLSLAALLKALFAGEEKPPAVVTGAAPPAAQSEAGAAPPAVAIGGTAEALNHYRRALDALRAGNWQVFGSEMDALEKTLQAGASPPQSP